MHRPIKGGARLKQRHIMTEDGTNSHTTKAKQLLPLILIIPYHPTDEGELSKIYWAGVV